MTTTTKIIHNNIAIFVHSLISCQSLCLFVHFHVHISPYPNPTYKEGWKCNVRYNITPTDKPLKRMRSSGDAGLVLLSVAPDTSFNKVDAILYNHLKTILVIFVVKYILSCVYFPHIIFSSIGKITLQM